MDWCRTWSIHPFITISPPTHSTTVTECDGRRPRLRVAIDSSSTEELEHDATFHFRRSIKPARKRLRLLSGTENDAGNFVRVVWIPPVGRGNDATAPTQRHLYVEVWMQQAFSAAVTFCYGSKRSFEFCLARGLRSSYENMFGWMATISDGHVGMVAFSPQSDDLANAVAAWISTEYDQLHLDHRDSKEKIGPLSEGETRPLTLTFTTPRSIAEAGLETISLTVPPYALWKLYNSMLLCQSAQKDAITEHAEDKDETALPPIVRAMQCYILEAFAIDIATFPLTKVVTSSATLGVDGRYKPSVGSAFCTPDSLSAIRQMVSDKKASLKQFVDAAI